jgi:DNA-binding NtrC family response regulator
MKASAATAVCAGDSGNPSLQFEMLVPCHTINSVFPAARTGHGLCSNGARGDSLKRILIVDDEQAVIATLRDYFVSLALEVDCASSLDEARSKLTADRYDAVVTDLQLSRMGDTEGLDLADFVAKRYPEIPLVVLTAYGSHRVEREARSRGASFFLHKPVRLEDIGQIVVGLLDAK